MDDWRQQKLVAPVDELLGIFPEDSVITDSDSRRLLAEGIDSVFRTEVAAQYPDWPSGSTTDGALVGVCQRLGGATIDVTGMMYIDFDGDLFPFRAVLQRTESSLTLHGFIGEVDSRTGGPPRLPRGTMINPAHAGNESLPTPELLVGHRGTPIAWTKALDWSLHSPTI